MNSKGFTAVALALILTLLATAMPACAPIEEAEGYVAVVPKVLHSGSKEAISVTLFNGEKLITGRVEVTLLKGGEKILQVKERVEGKERIEFDVPNVEEGEYEIQIKGQGFEDRAKIRIERRPLIFLETDKPIYKPGQTIRMRAVTLNAELRPVSELVTVDVLDAKGIKIFRSEVNTDEYGMVTLDLPISQEPNLGAWKIIAATEKGSTQLDVRVERYVLPKYEVKAELGKNGSWSMNPLRVR